MLVVVMVAVEWRWCCNAEFVSSKSTDDYTNGECWIFAEQLLFSSEAF